MKTVAMGSVSVLNVDDGVGVSSSIVDYAVSDSGTVVPGSPMVDGQGNQILSTDGKPLTDGSWSTTIPTVQQGQYLWTRTRLLHDDGAFDMIYNVSYSGENGSAGSDGASITGIKEQWYLSTSSSSLTGGAWSYEEPSSVPDGKYLWGRLETTLSNGQTKYSDAVYRATIDGLIDITDTINQKITQKIWSTDISSGINTYDSTTTQAIRDRVTQTETDISGITSRVSATESTLLTKADGSTVTALSNTVTQNKQTADAFQQTVESTYAQLTDVDDKINNIKVGGNNLYVIKDEVPGYLHGTNGSISSQSSTNKEFTSAYIPVKEGENYVIQSWCTPSATGESWLAYQYFSNNTGTPLAGRVSKYGKDSGSGVETTADGLEHLVYKVTVPENAKYLRISYRQFNDGYAMVEKATTPSEYSINSQDLENYADQAVSSAKSEIKQTTDAIELTVSSKVGASEIISKINQSPESITISAEKVNLVGQVTFNMLDSSAQNQITTAQSTADTAIKGMKSYTGTCSTATGTAAKVVSCSDTDFDMINGVTITVTFSTASTADAPTLNVNSKGAKNIYFDNAVTSSSNKFRWQANSVITFQYNGTYWVVLHYENLQYFTSSTAAGTAEKTNASATGTFVLCRGTTINVFFSTANSANAPTLNIGSTGAYAIYYKNVVTSSSNKYLWDAGTTVTFTFNGSYWYVNDGGAQLVKDYAKTSVDWVGTNGTAVVTAKDIIGNWATDATSTSTTIKGGLIQTHTILSQQLATNAIMSNNYSSGVANSDTPSGHYSTTGTFLDLSDGAIYMPNFGVSSTGEVYMNGTVYANAGQIGDPGNAYWEIGTVYGTNWDDHAGLVAHGDALIQAGKLTMTSDRINSQNAGSYVKIGDYWYDFGMQVPNPSATGSIDGATHKKNFLYIRRIGTQPTTSTVDNDWSYLFRVENNGDIYWNGHNISEGTYLPLSGGTVTGNLTVTGTLTGTLTGNASSATQWASAQKVYVTLGTASTTTTIQGGSSSAQTIGVNGTLGVGNGGTGKSQWTQWGIVYASTTSALSQVAAGTSGQILTSGGSAAPGWTNQSSLSVGSATKATQDANGDVIASTYRKLANNTFDTIDVTDINVGDMVVTGAASFTNGLSGNLTGDVTGNASTATLATTATKVQGNLKIQLNSGTTEGTNQFTYNGEAGKTVNITKGGIGLGNVENTALSTWAGSANLTTVKVGTLAAAATKGVDTSISAGSTSANLPTSQAVASFVEGKGYVTTSGVTSVQVQATSPVVSSTSTASTTTLSTTISLADGYGDTKNPYASKTANYFLAAPNGSNGAPTFRAIVAADIPTLASSKVGLGNVTNNKQVKGLSSGTTSGHIVTWGSDGYTVADGGIAKGSLATKVTLAGSDYSASSNTITITQANLQSAVQSTSLLLMTSDERSKLASIQVSEGGTIDFSGVTASAPLTATVATNKTVNITHNTSGVSAGTYRSVTVNTYGHVTAGTNPTTLSGYGITDAKIASGIITLGSNTITPLTASSTLDATKLSGTASISTTGNATTATKFSSARSIALTGDVTGSASSNGENGWSITTTVGDNSHNHDSTTIVPMAIKTYTDVIATANNEAAGQLYFMKVLPDSYTGQWEIHYKVTATITGVSVANGSGYEDSDVYISGMRNTYAAYKTWNNISNTSYRPYYYHCIYRAKEAGITGGYGHAVGINLRYSWNPATAANVRTVAFEIIETKGCTVTFFDAPLTYANLPGTGSTNYENYTNFDATTQGNTMSGDRNDVNYYNRNYYGSRVAAAAVYRYQLCLTKKDRSLLPINSVNNSIATNKALTTESFDPFGDILYWSSTSTYAAGANVGDGWYSQFLADLRYSFNIGGYDVASTLVARKPLYLVASPQTDGTAKLHSSPLAQDLPSTEDGLIYIYLGQVYQDTYPYRVYLTILHPIYWYIDGNIQIYTHKVSSAISADNSTNATYLNHLTVNNTSLHNTAGTFAFSGSGEPWSGTDWVGLQVGDSADKFQVTVNSDHHMLLRHNDSGGTNATWQNWLTILDSSNYNSYAPSLTGTGASGSWNITAAKATADASGNTITSYYCTLSTAQTVSGVKTFSGANTFSGNNTFSGANTLSGNNTFSGVNSFTNTTASTSKSTGAVKVSGGMGVAGRMSANENMIGDHVVLSYNSTFSCLDFTFV